MARDRAAGADPELEALITSAGKEAREALTELRELPADSSRGADRDR